MMIQQPDSGRSKYRAFAYLRVSGRGQIKGDGFPRQRERIAAFAQSKRFDVVREYRDGGVSGTKEIGERAGFMDMVVDADAEGVGIIIVENPDRLARTVIAAELAIAEMQRLGIEVWSADGGRSLTAGDSADPTTKLIRQVLAAVAEYDKDQKVLRLRLARQRRKKETGRCEGRKPFGEKDGEQETLKKIVQLNRKFKGQPHRRTYAEIADVLNAESNAHPSCSGRPWTVRMISNVLTRPSESNSSRHQSLQRLRSEADGRRRA